MDYFIKFSLPLIYFFLVILPRVPLSNANRSDDSITSAGNVVVAKRQAGALCVPLTALNGQVNYLQTNPRVPFSFGTTAILTCNFGYTMSGSSSSICTNAIWTPPLGTCNQLATTLTMLSGGQRGCLALFPPPNGQLAYSDGGPIGPFPLGTTVTLECRPGFVPIGGTITATCENGLWEPMALGMCNPTGTGMPAIGMQPAMQPMPGTIGAGLSMGALGSPDGSGGGGVLGCPPLLSALGGVVEYSTLLSGAGMYASGTVATLVCNNPGSVPTQPSSTCMNGIWSPPLLICHQGGAGGAAGGLLPSTLGGGGMRPTMMPGGGLLPPPNGGAFSALPGGLRGAGLTHCLLPIALPLGGQVSYSQGGLTGPFPVGAVATLTCMSGTPTGQTMSRCDGGQWMPPFFQPCSFSDSTTGSNNNLNRFNNFMSVSPSPIGDGGGASFGTPSSSSSSWSSVGNGEKRPAGGGSTSGEVSGSGQMLTGRCTFGMPDVMGGTINYSQGGPFGPYPPGTIASLHCHNGGVSTSYMSSSCLNGGWTPPVLGPCGPSTTGVPEGGGMKSGGEGAGNNRMFGSTPTLVFGSNTLFPTTMSFGSGAENDGDPEGGALAPRSSGGGVEGGGGGGDLPLPPFPTPNSILLSGLSTMTHLLAQCLLGPLAPLNGHVTFAPPLGAGNNGGAVNGGGMLTMGPYARGTTATLTCNPGFAPTGPTIATCEGGMFQPNFGQCMAMASAGDGGMGGDGGGMMGEQVRTTRPFLARTPNNGAVAPEKVEEKRVIEDMERETTAMPVVHLTEDRVTTADGCPEIVLPNGGGRIRYEPTTLVDGDGTAHGKQHALGTRARLECEEGFTNAGGSTTTCERVGWTAPVLGNCVPREPSSAVTPSAPPDEQPSDAAAASLPLPTPTTRNGSSDSGEESSINSTTSPSSLSSPSSSSLR